jgi:hypothetical protein
MYEHILVKKPPYLEARSISISVSPRSSTLNDKEEPVRANRRFDHRVNAGGCER